MEMRREAKTSEKKLEKRSNGYRTVKTKFVPPDHPAIIITS